MMTRIAIFVRTSSLIFLFCAGSLSSAKGADNKSAAKVEAPANYVLQPSDVIKVQVFQEAQTCNSHECVRFHSEQHARLEAFDVRAVGSASAVRGLRIRSIR